MKLIDRLGQALIVGMGFCGVLVGIIGLSTGLPPVQLMPVVGAVLLAAFSYAIWQARPEAGVMVFGLGVSALIAVNDVVGAAAFYGASRVAIAWVALVVISTVDLRVALPYVVGSGALVSLGGAWNGAWLAVATELIVYVVALSAHAYVVADAARQRAALSTRLDDVEMIVEGARSIATGDLGIRFSGDDDLSRVINQMVQGLRDLVGRIRSSAGVMIRTGDDITVLNKDFIEGAAEQAAAVEQVVGLSRALSGRAAQVSEAAQDVLNLSGEASINHMGAADRMQELTRSATQIARLLDSIKAIAEKSEVLALNASLEGIRAGDAGRGFGVVAEELQKLTADVQQAVATVRRLVVDIRARSADVDQALDDVGMYSERTAEAARTIHRAALQQQQGLSQLQEGMSDILRISQDVRDRAENGARTTEQLQQLSEDLRREVGRFVLD